MADAHGQGIDLLLQDTLDVFDLRLLPQQVGRPITQLIDRIGRTMACPETHPHGERGAYDTDYDEHSCRHDDGVTEVKLLYSTRFAADKYDIHADCSSKAVIVLQSGALCLTEW